MKHIQSLNKPLCTYKGGHEQEFRLQNRIKDD